MPRLAGAQEEVMLVDCFQKDSREKNVKPSHATTKLANPREADRSE
jgi:hypothetical protein